jgi:AcrR family transcriptional regulator
MDGMLSVSRISKAPEVRKTEIMDAADALFHEKGYHETAVSDIVKANSIAQGTFYYHFKSKEAVLEALIHRQLSQMVKTVREISDSKELTPPRKMELVVGAVIDNLRRNGGFMFDFLYTDKYLHIVDKCARFADKMLSPMVLEIIEEGNSKGIFKVLHPSEILIFVSSILECLDHSLYQKRSPEQLAIRFEIASMFMNKALGLPDGTIKLETPVIN